MATAEDDARKVAKLPKWARRRIETLEADAAYLRAEALQMRTPGASRVRLVHLDGGRMIEVGLPEDAVAFYPDPAKDENITVSVADDHVEIRVGGRGATVLALLPQCGNVAWARVEERR